LALVLVRMRWSRGELPRLAVAGETLSRISRGLGTSRGVDDTRANEPAMTNTYAFNQ
jgi:hypothetical protein